MKFDFEHFNLCWNLTACWHQLYVVITISLLMHQIYTLLGQFPNLYSWASSLLVGDVQDIGNFTIVSDSEVQVRHDLHMPIGQSKAPSCLNPIDLSIIWHLIKVCILSNFSFQFFLPIQMMVLAAAFLLLFWTDTVCSGNIQIGKAMWYGNTHCLVGSPSTLGVHL